MKKIYLLLLTLFSFCPDGYGRQWLIFYGEYGTSSNKGGHVFISFFKEHKDLGKTIQEYSWGYYPRKKEMKVLWGEIVPGEVKSDYKVQKALGLLVEISEEEYDASMNAVKIWNSQKSQLLEHNTIDFVRDIASILIHIQQPHGAFLSPKLFINELKKVNSEMEALSVINFNINEIGVKNADKKDSPIVKNEAGSTLSPGVSLLFKGVKTKLTATEKNSIFTKLGFHVSKDRKQFAIEGGDDYPFTAEVLPTDMNKDGHEEIFVSYGNTFTSGNTGAQIVLFIKNNSGNYEPNLDFPGLIPEALKTGNQGYSDLLIGLPGFTFPIWRWDGNKYYLYRKIRDKDFKALEKINVSEVSTQYANTIK